MIRRIAAAGLAGYAALTATTAPALAHGFGQRFDLPLPLWLWVTGAGASIVLSFVVMAIFVRERSQTGGYRSYDLRRNALFRALSHPIFVGVIRAAAAMIFVLTIVAGFAGSQDSYSNLITTMVWVVWWVGFAFVCALVGNLWQLVNPLRTIFRAAEIGFVGVFGGRSLSLNLRYPRWLGRWPALVLFVGFAWLELVWAESDIPASIARALLSYSVITWIGMLLWGRETWLRNGEAFTIAFGILARFAPLHVPERSETSEPRRLELRPPGAGLMDYSGVTAALFAFVMLMLATVTFDGFIETSLFRSIMSGVFSTPWISNLLFDISEWGFPERQVAMTAMLILFPLVFIAAFMATSWVMTAVTRRYGGPSSSAGAVGTGKAALAFVLTLVPIAVAYHLSHYFSYLLTTGQYIIPLISDPLGNGADLFGTADYRVSFTVLSPYFYWYASVALIIIGHVIAVYLAHVVALRLYRTRRAALVSQIPMVVLMVLYTSLSLWILAQPIVG